MMNKQQYKNWQGNFEFGKKVSRDWFTNRQHPMNERMIVKYIVSYTTSEETQVTDFFETTRGYRVATKSFYKPVTITQEVAKDKIWSWVRRSKVNKSIKISPVYTWEKPRTNKKGHYGHAWELYDAETGDIIL